MEKENPLFVTWTDEKGKQVAYMEASKAINKSHNLMRSKASNVYRGMETNLSVRDGFSRNDYNVFRPDETVPTDPKEIIKTCRNAYRKIGIVNNIINLMSDFTIQGAHLVHPNPEVNKFYNEWWDKINGFQVCSKFSRALYRDGISITQRTTAKLKAKDIENLKKGWTTGADIEVEPPLKVEKKEVPWKYVFLNPLLVSPLGDDLAIFSGDDIMYSLDLPPRLISRIKDSQDSVDKIIVSNMPQDIVSLIKSGAKKILLDNKKIKVFHYKKDDYDLWADPMLRSVMDDLIMLNKMKLADLAALDGAISRIRLWKLGNFEYKVLPTEAAVQKLADMLLNNVGGGSMDLIWGPELELHETSSDVYKFLGNEKYVPVLNAIYAGLGIPPTLTGAATSGGFTNNYISLQTLLERLNYVRVLLVDFWNREIKMVQQAMGFREPATIQFDRMTLTDEAAEKNLLIQLYDRNIITLETIQERFKEIPEIEKIRDRRERRQRKNGKLSRKAGPWNNPEHKEALEKIALQSGVSTPSEVGLELSPKKSGEKPALLMVPATPTGTFPAKKNKGQPQQGRPKNSSDTQKRKKKRVLPRTAAEFTKGFAFARKAQKDISDILDPIWLAHTGKKNMRSLSEEEFQEIEKYKFAVLCSFDLHDDITEEKIVAADALLPEPVDVLARQTVSQFHTKFGKEPSIEEVRQIWASVYVLFKGDFENGESDN
jgi:hypothetical protein